MTITSLPDSSNSLEEVDFTSSEFRERLIELMPMIPSEGQDSDLQERDVNAVKSMRDEILKLTIMWFKYESQISSNSAFIRAAYKKIMVEQWGAHKLGRKA